MRFEELTSPEVAALDRDRTVLILPLGSVEQHGNHMPLGTDTLLAHAVSLAAAEQSTDVAVLPPPWYGFSAHHMRFAGSITLRAETLMAVEDVVGRWYTASDAFSSPTAMAVRRRHRPGDARAQALRHGADRHLTIFSWAREAIAALRRSETGGMGHACEFETAMMQHIRSDLVKMELAATTYPDTGSRYLTTDLLGGSAVRTFLDFGDLSSTGTLGDPSLASPEMGAKFFEAVVGKLVAFIEDFRGWRIPERLK